MNLGPRDRNTRDQVRVPVSGTVHFVPDSVLTISLSLCLFTVHFILLCPAQTPVKRKQHRNPLGLGGCVKTVTPEGSGGELTDDDG